MAYERVWNGTAWVGASDTITPPPGGGGGAATAGTIATAAVVHAPTVFPLGSSGTVPAATVVASATVRTAIVAAGGGGAPVQATRISAFAAVKVPTVTGSAPPPPTSGLQPWNLSVTYPAGAPLVFPHYFTQFPPVQDEATPDYYDKHWMPPGALEGTTQHAIYGGFVRDRYPVLPHYGGTQLHFQTEAIKWEVREAIKAKMDGFTIDILSRTPLSGSGVGHWRVINALFDAVDYVNTTDGTSFKLWFMVDGTSGTGLGTGTTLSAQILQSAAELAGVIAPFRNRACMFKPNGRMLLGVFGAELWGSQSKAGVNTSWDPALNTRHIYWKTLQDQLQTTYNQPTDMWGCYVTPDPGTDWTTAAATFNDIFIGHSRWGTRDPVSNAKTDKTERGAAAYCRSNFPGRKWMHWAAPGDTRPATSKATFAAPWTYASDENEGSLGMHESWMAGIDGLADQMQHTTWNDLVENAHIMPSKYHGWVLLDLAGYYIEWYKNKTPPLIRRDGLYLFHPAYNRTVALNKDNTASDVNHNNRFTTPTGQYKFATLHGGTAIKNIVEVTAFLTAPASIDLMIDGSNLVTWSGVAGRNRWEAPMPSSGSILSARATRSGVLAPGTLVTSPYPLLWSINWDDFLWRAASSLRQV